MNNVYLMQPFDWQEVKPKSVLSFDPSKSGRPKRVKFWLNSTGRCEVWLKSGDDVAFLSVCDGLGQFEFTLIRPTDVEIVRDNSVRVFARTTEEQIHFERTSDENFVVVELGRKKNTEQARAEMLAQRLHEQRMAQVAEAAAAIDAKLALLQQKPSATRQEVKDAVRSAVDGEVIEDVQSTEQANDEVAQPSSSDASGEASSAGV